MPDGEVAVGVKDSIVVDYQTVGLVLCASIVALPLVMEDMTSCDEGALYVLNQKFIRLYDRHPEKFEIGLVWYQSLWTR